MSNSAEIRINLLDALKLDLIGPDSIHHPHAKEIISQPPSQWYLSGFLVPNSAPLSIRRDDTLEEEIDQVNKTQGSDDEINPEIGSAKKRLFPSSIGLSLLINRTTFQQLEITVEWGDY